MSWKISGLVWELDLTHSQQSVLLAMADHAHHDGSKVFPSVALISWKTGYSDRQVRRVTSELRELEILILVKESNRYRPREYKIDISAGKEKEPFRTDKVSSLGDEEESAPTCRADTGVRSDNSGLTPASTRTDIAKSTRGDTAMSTRTDTMSDKSFKELSKELSVNQDDKFSVFWDRIRYAIKLTYSSMPSATKQKLDATQLFSIDDGCAIVLCLMGDEQCAWLTDRMSIPIERELKLISDSEITEVQFVTSADVAQKDNNEKKQE